MGAEKGFKAKPQRKAKTRILKLILAIAVVLVVLVVFVVPWFVSSETGRKIILGKINSSIDGEADFSPWYSEKGALVHAGDQQPPWARISQMSYPALAYNLRHTLER